jgi:hypothetical protein
MPYEKHLRSSVAGKLPTPLQLAEGQIALNFNAADPFLAIKDAAGAVRRLTGISQGTTAPTSPTAGAFWLDQTVAASPVFKVFDGTKWITTSAPANHLVAGNGVTASTAHEIQILDQGVI